MIWNPIILGIIEDPFSTNFWIIVPITVVGFFLCYFRYKLTWIVLPIVMLVCGIFLAGFLEIGNYNHISELSPGLIPKAVFGMIVSITVTIAGAFFGWRRHQKVNLK